jgi:hypothetical protein
LTAGSCFRPLTKPSAREKQIHEVPAKGLKVLLSELMMTGGPAEIFSAREKGIDREIPK